MASRPESDIAISATEDETSGSETETDTGSLSIFVSYRRSDSASTTGRLTDYLYNSFGRESVVKDVDSVPLGIDYRTFIDSKVKNCDVLLAVIGKGWIGAATAEGGRRLDDPRDLVRLEIQMALERDIPVIPILVDGAGVPAEEDLPEPLRPLAFRNGIPVRPDPDFRNDVRRLITGLSAYRKDPGP